MFLSRVFSLSTLARHLRASEQVNTTIKRLMSTQPLKKFYQRATISEASGGKFEINLDKKKLKTPGLKVFQVPTEALAMVVAHEWNSQEDTIKRHAMHMTLLCNTAIDNPTGRSRETVLNHILEFLDTDTVCYRADEPSELQELQTNEWDPLIDWVEERYNVRLQVTHGIAAPEIPEETKQALMQHLLSFNDWALVGYQHAVDVVKSLVITLSLVDRRISVEKAVSLSRLEQEFQIGNWGNVEWYHDVDLEAQRSRLAAAIMFLHLTSMDTRTTFNKSEAGQPV